MCALIYFVLFSICTEHSVYSIFFQNLDSRFKILYEDGTVCQIKLHSEIHHKN